VAAAIVAWRQVGEARRLREAQAEPFVVVDFDVQDSREIYIVISKCDSSSLPNWPARSIHTDLA
jgi:hypothetical protein